MIDILPKIVKTDVTCVKSYNNCILAAVGNTVQVFTKVGQQLQTFKVFDGQKVHGIVPNESNKLAFFGGNQLKIFEFDFLVTKITNELASRHCEDWIFDLQWVDASMSVATIFAHNFISLWNVSNLSLAKRVSCKQKCILYSAKLINETWSSLYVFSGTVFGQILIWNPASANCNFADVLYRLEGHDGAIFSIDYSALIIATTSDDRTVRIWQTSEDIFSDNTTKVNSTITLKHTLYGHTARIFKCKIFRNLIVTAGEDSFVSIWSLNGKLLRKFETHQGGCVWALDMCNESLSDYIFTGGGDSGVSVFPKELLYKDYLLEIPKEDVPKILKLTAAGNAVLVTTDGSFKYFNKELKTMKFIHTYEGFKSYAIMEVSETRDLVALAGFNGAIYIYKERPNDLLEFICDYKPDGNRIFALHWLSSSMFLTSTINGLMNCWIVQNKDEEYTLVKMHYQYILPECKERWATCASLCDNSKLVVGDRKGNIHLYESDKAECIHTIKKAHCHLGVTYLYYIDEQLYSLGRNGILNKYYLNDKSLTHVASDKLPFSWIASMETIDDIIFLYGFSGSDFILYNLNQRRIILTVFCGGGHRSWDCMVTKSKLFYFDYIKDKQVHVYSSKWSNISKSNIIDGYHTKEINCGVIIKSKNKFVVLSGGEDTTIRLALIDETYKFHTLQTIKSHLSSVRCITHCLLHKNNREHTYFVFSGGGRAQIIFHRLYFDLVHDKIDCQQIYSYYKPLNDSDAETRIMDLVTIHLQENILLVAGCSDGTLKCFRINIDQRNFVFVTEIKYKYKCIIRLSYINVRNNHIIVSMATDGKLVFWDFNQICSKISSGDAPSDINPFFELKTHQSGINSFDYRELMDTKYLIASGGDDNAIILTTFNFILNNEIIDVDVIKQIKICDVHAAQITGLYLTEKYLISASIDQNISVFIYDIEDNKINCTLLNQYNSSISDIQGMKCIKNKECLAMIYGKGVEICSIKI